MILALFLIASQVAQLAINIIEKGDKLTTFCIEHGDHQLFSVIESEHLWVNILIAKLLYAEYFYIQACVEIVLTPLQFKKGSNNWALVLRGCHFTGRI